MKKKVIIALVALLPLNMLAQDNTWERPEVEEVPVQEKEDPNAKYLKGAVTEEDGRVVFTTTTEAPGKSAADIYAIAKQYLQKMISEKNQIQSRLITEDTEKNLVAAAFEEWLVFKSTSLALDRTRLYYGLQAQCKDGKLTLKMGRIRYLYEEERKPQHLSAEEWITDKVALNKKGTKVLPVSGKFRRKTIDRKDFIFNKFKSLLQ